MKTLTAVTHDGRFHADDVFAAVILRESQADNVNLKIERTRDPAVIEAADIAFDVGCEYDPGRNRFDHHQVSAPSELARSNSVPYASAGLVWKHVGMTYLRRYQNTLGAGYPVGSTELQKLWAIVDEELIQPVDASDTGSVIINGPMLTISGIIDLHNVKWEYATAFSHVEKFLYFNATCEFARSVLQLVISNGISKIKAEKLIADAPIEDRVMILSENCPWQRNLFALGLDSEVYFVVYPDNDETWRAQCVPPSPGSFDKKVPLPRAWAGKRDEELQKISGCESAIFCHPNLFICGAKTKEDVIAMARKALDARAVEVA